MIYQSRAQLLAKGDLVEPLEYKFCKFATSDISAKGLFTGYASRFGNEDSGGDIVQKGAFKSSLAQKEAKRFKLLYEHDTLAPVGYWTDLQEDEKGLLGTGQLMVDDLAKAREVHALMKAGVLDGLSIGYRVRKSSYADRTNQVRVLEDIDLMEISVVMFPMNSEAVISAVKSDPPIDPADVREFEKWLMQDAGLTRSKARQILGGLKTVLLKTMPDAGGEVASTQPDVAWSAPFEDSLRRLVEAIR